MKQVLYFSILKFYLVKNNNIFLALKFVKIKRQLEIF